MLKVFLVAVSVVASTVAHAEVLELEGTVKAVDPETRTLSVERKTLKGSKVLELEVNKSAGDLDAVKVGDIITFSYDPDLELVTKVGGGPTLSAGHSEPPPLNADILLKTVEALVENLQPSQREAIRPVLARTYVECRDYARAKQEISEIDGPDKRARAAMSVAVLMAKQKDYKAAREQAAAVEASPWREEALLGVIQEEARQGYRAGHDKLIADLLSSDASPALSVSRRIRLVAILDDKSMQNKLLEEAVRTAKPLPDERTRDMYLQQILEHYLRLQNYKAAHSVVPFISKGRSKWGFSHAARQYYREGRLTEGDRLLREGFGDDWQSHRPMERAIAEAGDGDLKPLEVEAGRIPDVWKRFEFLIAVGTSYAERGVQDASVRCLDKASRLIPAFKNENQRNVAESDALELATKMLSKGMPDDGTGIRIARESPKLRTQRIMQVCTAYIKGGAFEEARGLINSDLEEEKDAAICSLAKSEVIAGQQKEMPSWISDLDSSSSKAWAYLGCCQALNEKGANSTN
jgi:hypothetical protein